MQIRIEEEMSSLLCVQRIWLNKLNHATSNCFTTLGTTIRNNPNMFNSNDAIRALVQKVVELKPNMKGRDISGLLNVLSKARVPSKSRPVHQKLMFVLSELAVSELSGFNARAIATTLNALAQAKHSKSKSISKSRRGGYSHH
jgi:hypothetical protein